MTVFLAYLKHVSERRWWNGFKQRAEEWVNELVQAEERHPNELSEAEWRVECERLLSDANFGPLQIEQLLEISVAIAKGYANDKLFR